jgi:hypothetical protein
MDDLAAGGTVEALRDAGLLGSALSGEKSLSARSAAKNLESMWIVSGCFRHGVSDSVKPLDKRFQPVDCSSVRLRMADTRNSRIPI